MKVQGLLPLYKGHFNRSWQFVIHLKVESTLESSGYAMFDITWHGACMEISLTSCPGWPLLSDMHNRANPVDNLVLDSKGLLWNKDMNEWYVDNAAMTWMYWTNKQRVGVVGYSPGRLITLFIVDLSSSKWQSHPGGRLHAMLVLVQFPPRVTYRYDYHHTWYYFLFLHIWVDHHLIAIPPCCESNLLIKRYIVFVILCRGDLLSIDGLQCKLVQLLFLW